MLAKILAARQKLDEAETMLKAVLQESTGSGGKMEEATRSAEETLADFLREQRRFKEMDLICLTQVQRHSELYGRA